MAATGRRRKAVEAGILCVILQLMCRTCSSASPRGPARRQTKHGCARGKRRSYATPIGLPEAAGNAPGWKLRPTC
jgi:hypothetical protein